MTYRYSYVEIGITERLIKNMLINTYIGALHCRDPYGRPLLNLEPPAAVEGIPAASGVVGPAWRFNERIVRVIIRDEIF